MNRLFSLAIIMLSGIFLGAFIANADTLIEGDAFQANLEKNTMIKPPNLEPKFTMESSYCIVNETTADVSVFINDVSVWMEPGTIIWGECANDTDEYSLEIESSDPSSELLLVDLFCGDLVKIQARK